MKKNLLGLSAISIALILSAFTKKNTLVNFKLLVNPTAAGIVTEPAHWSIYGYNFGRCDVSPHDLACDIQINFQSMENYIHEDDEEYVLNSPTYANSQNPKKGYLQIYEELSGTGNYIITVITAYKWSGSAYVADSTVDTYTDIAFRNARD